VWEPLNACCRVHVHGHHLRNLLPACLLYDVPPVGNRFSLRNCYGAHRNNGHHGAASDGSVLMQVLSSVRVSVDVRKHCHIMDDTSLLFST
jgi:hypothetical protein